MLKQLEKYDSFLLENAADLVEAYTSVCKTLMRLLSPGRFKRLHTLIVAVANDQCSLEVDPISRLLVFGYDQDQKHGDVFRDRIEYLKQHLGKRVISKGNAHSFDLLKDTVELDALR